MDDYKNFQNGTALTAEVMNNLIMEQTIPRFSTAATRNTYIPAPEVGQHCYLASTNQTLRYDGTGWVELIPASVGGLAQKPLRVCTSTTRPSHSAGQTIYETDTRRNYTSDGTKWILTGGAVPMVMVRRNTAANLTVNAWTALPWVEVLTTDSSTPSMWSSSNPARITVPVDGLYSVSGAIQFNTPTSGSSSRYLGLRKNGANTSIRRGHSLTVAANQEGEMNITSTFRLVAGDYVEMVYYTGFVNDTTPANTNEVTPHLTVAFIGGT